MDYMVTVDFYSNFWKLNYLPDTWRTTCDSQTEISCCSSGDTRCAHFWQWTAIFITGVRNIQIKVRISTQNLLTSKPWLQDRIHIYALLNQPSTLRTRTLLPTKETLLELMVANNKPCLRAWDRVQVQPFEPCKSRRVAKVIGSDHMRRSLSRVLRRNRRSLITINDRLQNC